MKCETLFIRRVNLVVGAFGVAQSRNVGTHFYLTWLSSTATSVCAPLTNDRAASLN